MNKKILKIRDGNLDWKMNNQKGKRKNWEIQTKLKDTAKEHRLDYGPWDALSNSEIF